MEQNGGVDTSQLVSLETANKLNTEAANSQKEAEPEQPPKSEKTPSFLSRFTSKSANTPAGGDKAASQSLTNGYIF